MENTTSNLKLQNKDLIHIGVEVVVLLILAYYFSSQNKKLQVQVEELTGRLQEKDLKVKNLEDNLEALKNHVIQLSQQTTAGFSSVSEKIKEVTELVNDKIQEKDRRRIPKKPEKPEKQEKKEVIVVGENKKVLFQNPPLVTPTQKPAKTPLERINANINTQEVVPPSFDSSSDEESDDEDSDLEEEVVEELRKLEKEQQDQQGRQARQEKETQPKNKA